ncbi:MAG TPA: glycosyltransferase [Thermomicrobiaceae bacterium]|nr:glycosyltransferase [Thermomicrobiaceae bacterium]
MVLKRGDFDQRLGVVLIARDQEWNVRRLIESVLEETRGLPGTEIVLVDSASRDGTAAVACDYPIEVIRLDAEQRLTAAAGRVAGMGRLSVDVVLFLDGDMELRRGWLTEALGLLRHAPEIAVVSGQIVDLPLGVTFSTRGTTTQVGAAVIDVTHGGGAALYRRAALDSVGSFNAALYSEEEPELCLRLRCGGWRVVRLERPMVSHYTAPTDRIGSLFGRRRRRLYLGAGQVVRLHAGTPLTWTYLRERGYALPAAAGLGASGLALVASAARRDARPLVAWLVLAALALGADAARKRSPYRTLHSLVVRLLFLEGMIRGYRLGADAPALPRFAVLRERLPEDSDASERNLVKGVLA